MTDRYLSPTDAADFLGIDVSTLWRHFGRAIHCGRVKTLKIGRARRILLSSLLEEAERQSKENGHAGSQAA